MPGRYVLIAVTFSLSMLLYVDRVAISTAKGPISAELGLTDTEFGWALSAFALGYALFQAPSGALADHFGPRRVLTALVLVWSVFTALTAAASSLLGLLAFRFLFGVGEGGAYPTCARAFYAWLPASERGLAQGINFSGSRLGAAFALPAVAWLVASAGWRRSFLLLGLFGVVWALGWWLWFRDDPAEHSWVSDQERREIAEGRRTAGGPSAIPTARDLWRSPDVWVAMGQYFASNFTFFFCLTWLFPYLQRTYRLGPVEAGVLAAAPLVAGAFGNWVGGWIVDRLYRRDRWRQSRQWPAIGGFVLAAAGLIGSLLVEHPLASVASLSVAIFGADMTLPPSWAFCIDIGRNAAGTVAGTMNMAGNLGSFATSLAFPYLLAMTGATWPFFLVGAVLNLGAAWLWTYARPERGLTAT